jgi:WD40 repeat protein
MYKPSRSARTGDSWQRKIIAGSRSGTGYLAALGFSPDSRILVSSCEGARTNIWNAVEGTLAGQLTGERGGLRGPVAFSPDQQTLFTIESRVSVSMWDVATCKLQTTLSQPGEAVTYLALSGDGTTLAAGYLTRLCVWDVASQTVLMHKRVERLNTLAFGPQGELVASLDNGRLEFWNPRAGQLQRTMTLHPDRGAVQQLLFDDDSRAFALYGNGTIDVLSL